MLEVGALGGFGGGGVATKGKDFSAELGTGRAEEIRFLCHHSVSATVSIKVGLPEGDGENVHFRHQTLTPALLAQHPGSELVNFAQLS